MSSEMISTSSVSTVQALPSMGKVNDPSRSNVAISSCVIAWIAAASAFITLP